MVQCFAVAGIKFLMVFEQETLYFAVGPANYVMSAVFYFYSCKFRGQVLVI